MNYYYYYYNYYYYYYHHHHPPFEKLLDIVHSIFKCYMYSFIIENLRLWLDLEGLNFVLLLTGYAQGTASGSTTSAAPRNNWGSHPPDDDLQGAKMSSWSLPPRQGWWEHLSTDVSLAQLNTKKLGVTSSYWSANFCTFPFTSKIMAPVQRA